MNIKTGELDETHEPRIARSVIRSCAKWNYELVQDVLDRKVMLESDLITEYKPLG
jgi:exoribonuclease R